MEILNFDILFLIHLLRFADIFYIKLNSVKF